MYIIFAKVKKGLKKCKAMEDFTLSKGKGEE